MKVRDILIKKGYHVDTVNPEMTVYEVLKLMADKNIGSLLVMEGKKVKGIFTERDYARKVVLKGKFSKEIPVSEVMHVDPISVTEEDDVEECMKLMTNKFIRHLPVLNNEELMGIISIGDVVSFIITQQQFIIENLDNYISGTKA